MRRSRAGVGFPRLSDDALAFVSSHDSCYIIKMTLNSARALPPSIDTPVWAAGLAVALFGLIGFSPFGSVLASAFSEGWLAVYMDAQAFRLVCM